MNKRILIVEDEARVVSFIKRGLTEEGFEVNVATEGHLALSAFQNENFDLVVLDIMLPGLNGYEVCRVMKSEKPHVPVIFVTALGTSENVVLGLNTGADDYLVKPFKFIELVARIKSLMRRQHHNSNHADQGEKASVFKAGPLEVNDFRKEVSLNGKPLTFTATEYRLLLFFIKNKGRVLSRSEILGEVWDVGFDVGTNVVDVYVNYLRRKIDQAEGEKIIHTVVGMGYVLKESV